MPHLCAICLSDCLKILKTDIVFRLWDTKWDIRQTVQAAFFHTMKLKGALHCQAPQKDKNHFIKVNKQSISHIPSLLKSYVALCEEQTEIWFNNHQKKIYLSSLICGQKGKSNGKAPIWFSKHDVIVKLVLLMVKLASYQTESWHFFTLSFLESIIHN